MVPLPQHPRRPLRQLPEGGVPGSSPARHPYKDTIVELDAIVGRLVAVLEETGQLDDTIVLVTSDNGPEMETWPDAAYTPFRCSKGSTWEGGVRVPAIVTWPGMVEVGRVSDGIVDFCDLVPTVLRLAGAEDALPDDRYSDGVDQTSFLLAGDRHSNRKFHHYWLGSTYSALRCGEYKFVLASTSDDPVTTGDTHNPGGFSGVTQKYTYARLHNLYLDPKESRSYMVRKLAYQEAFSHGIRGHLVTYATYPPKRVVGLG